MADQTDTPGHTGQVRLNAVTWEEARGNDGVPRWRWAIKEHVGTLIKKRGHESGYRMTWRFRRFLRGADANGRAMTRLEALRAARAAISKLSSSQA